MKIKNLLFKNTAINGLFRISSITVNFLLMPFIIHHIGIARFGIFIVVQVIVGSFGIFSEAIRSSILKHVSQYHSENNPPKMNSLISSVFFSFLIFGIISFLILLLLGTFIITRFFNIDPYLLGEARHSLIIVSFLLIFIFPLRAFEGILQGMQRYDLNSYTGWLTITVRTTAILFILKMGFGLIPLILVIYSAEIICHLLNIYFVKHVIPFLDIKVSNINREMLKIIYGFVSIMFLIKIFGLINTKMDQIIISIFINVSSVTYYEAANRLHMLLMSLTGLMTAAIVPAASYLYTERNFATLKTLLLRGNKYLQAIILPVAISIIFMAKPFLNRWLGAEFESVAIVAQIFVIYWLFHISLGVSAAILTGMGRIKFILFYFMSIAICNLFLSIIFVTKFYLGLVGVAIGTAIPHIIGAPFFLMYALKAISVPWKGFLKATILKTYPIALVVSLLLFLLISQSYPKSMLHIGLYAMFTFTIYLLLFYLFGLNKNERSEAIAKLSLKI
ncbi:oligosaccharide flippase family protein [Candidatus Omnitrophota bacterium]